PGHSQARSRTQARHLPRIAADARKCPPISPAGKAMASAILWQAAQMHRNGAKQKGRPSRDGPFGCSLRILGSAHDLLLELLGHLFDVLRRPARDFHAEAKAHRRQDFLDLVERLAAEVRRAQHLGLGLLDQIVD
ncbi:hypothetical protein QU38_00750, partial [Staphylococcus aureus]